MFLLDHPRGSRFKNDLSDEFLLLFSLVETRLITIFFEFSPRQNMSRKDIFVDHACGSGFKNDLSDEFLR
jgi:hypothetical protein